MCRGGIDQLAERCVPLSVRVMLAEAVFPRRAGMVLRIMSGINGEGCDRVSRAGKESDVGNAQFNV